MNAYWQAEVEFKGESLVVRREDGLGWRITGGESQEWMDTLALMVKGSAEYARSRLKDGPGHPVTKQAFEEAVRAVFEIGTDGKVGKITTNLDQIPQPPGIVN